MRRAASVIALFAAACGGPPHRARELSPTSVAVADSTVLVAMDDDVRWAIELVDHRAQLLADGRLRGQLRLVNRSGKEMELMIAWCFKDDRGFPVEAESPFEHVIVSGGQTLPLTRESLAGGATAFHVQVKSAK